MSLLTYHELCEIVAIGVISPVPHENINAASIDVCLGDTLLIESIKQRDIDLAKRDSPNYDTVSIATTPYALAPGQFVLAQTREKFYLPDTIACEFKLKSSIARAGLNHSLAGWCDPGWHDSVLTMELHNALQHGRLLLTAGMKIGQMVFFHGSPVPPDRSYRTRGRYNADHSVTTAKPAIGKELCAA